MQEGFGMQCILKILGGKSDGKKIQIATDDFVIGRGKTAQLRPSSDLISREHCAIRTRDGKIIIEDMGSRNGTFVNGKQLTSPHTAKAGDNLRVGRIQFEIVIDHVKPDNKKPKVTDVGEAASRTATIAKSDSIEDSISDWLTDDKKDDFEKINFRNKETLQFNIEELQNAETDSVSKSDSASSDSVTSVSADAEEDTEEDGKKKKKKKKKEYGKLPPRPKHSHGNSTSAADDVLKQFFNRR